MESLFASKVHLIIGGTAGIGLGITKLLLEYGA
jgi:NAD(P)-dependent dehydrogenase (short-subunit alcohol dehydrogenase family)